MKTRDLGSLGALTILVVFGGGLAGCAPDFDHLEIKIDTLPPLAVSVEPTNVALPVGIAVGITATPFDTSGAEMDSDVVLNLVPKNQQVLGVETSLDGRSFVLFGVGPGTTSISVQVDHVSRSDIPVTVKLQPME